MSFESGESKGEDVETISEGEYGSGISDLTLLVGGKTAEKTKSPISDLD